MGGWQDRGEHTTLTVTDTVTDGKAIYRYRNLTEAKILLLLGPAPPPRQVRLGLTPF